MPQFHRHCLEPPPLLSAATLPIAAAATQESKSAQAAKELIQRSTPRSSKHRRR
jgi:hypothetical protein